jgi:enamine deaminase RidA (YjgF/YER057c/UK114 family)
MRAGRGIERRTSADLDFVRVSNGEIDYFDIIAHPADERDPYSMFDNLAQCVRDVDARILKQYVFGDCRYVEGGIPTTVGLRGDPHWPVTWIQDDNRLGRDLTGTQVLAVSRCAVQPVVLDGRTVGGVFEDRNGRYCVLGQISSPNISAPAVQQARETLERLEVALEVAGMTMANVVRTWFYLAGILSWYDDFNSVRTKFYEERHLFDSLIPASTGIGGRNPAGAAVVADAYAVTPKTDAMKIRAVPSPLQCPATQYRSSFSRAVDVESPCCRHLYVSGTASIGLDGRTAHVGDTWQQIDLTMRVVEAILESRGMGWSDATRAIAYFKDIEDTPLYYRYCRHHRLPWLPVAMAHADICREDLLFEIELDAVRMGGAERPDPSPAVPCRP